MGFLLKSVPSFILLFVILLNVIGGGSAGMSCDVAFGMSFTCPVPFQDESKVYCCRNENNVPYCCDLPDYVVNSSAIVAGVITGSVILLLLLILCCCCCCSCCLLAKRRQARGVVIYDPVANAPPAPYPTVPQGAYPPQPVYPSAYPMHATVHSPPPPSYADISQQPPYNPVYPQQNR